MKKMKKTLFTVILMTSLYGMANAQQNNSQLKDITDAEENFNKQLLRKGINESYLSVLDADGIIFRPQKVNAKAYFEKNEKQPGKLARTTKAVRISANGDLAFTAGPYVLKAENKNDDDDIYGDYVSIWRRDINDNLKLLIDLNIQHPEPEAVQVADLKDPDFSKKSKTAVTKDPFNGRNIIITTDKLFNTSLGISSLSAYKEFLTPEGRYYFPGFQPMIGQDNVLKFLNNQAISISANNVGAGRSSSGDLAYSYGTAEIKKGGLTNQYNYVRIWEIDKNKKWSILLEIFSPFEY